MSAHRIWIVPTLAMVAVAIMLSCAWAEEEKDDEAAVMEKITETARQGIVEIRMEFQKDPTESEPRDWLVAQCISEKTWWSTSGVLIEPAGTVLMSDPMIQQKYIKKITVVDGSGKEHEAKLKGFLRNYFGWVLVIEGEDIPRGVVRFSDAGELRPERELMLALLRKENEKSYLSISAASLSFNSPQSTTSEDKPWVEFLGFTETATSFLSSLMSMSMGARGGSTIPRTPGALLFDEEGDAIGYALEGRAELGGDRYGWRGTDIVSDEVITFEDFDGLTEKMRERFANLICQVTIHFRQAAKDEIGGSPEGADFSRFRRVFRGRWEEAGNPLEEKLYGLAIGKKSLFVPRTLARERIRCIERIDVKVGEKIVSGKFTGAYKDFGGIIVTLDEDALGEVVDLVAAALPQNGRALLTVLVREKFDRRDEEVRYNRLVGTARGYKNGLRRVPAFALDEGTFILTLDGALTGFTAIERREETEMPDSAADFRFMMSRAAEGEASVYLFTEKQDFFANAAAHFDEQLRPLSEEESKRLVWLGVEFQGLKKDVAEHLGCSKSTREGEIGLLVNHVYADSPAARHEIKSGDILLKVKEKDKDDPIELMAGMGSEFGFDMSAFEAFGAEFGGMAGIAPWKSCRNELTFLLTRMGVGKVVELTYWRDGEERTIDVNLEYGPPDFESAKKYKDEKTGITVRDLTYEVRHALRLKPDKNAVVIEKVEEGSNAVSAGILPYELIMKLGDSFVDSVETFEKLLTEARKAGVEKVKVTLLRMGKTRIVDLALEEEVELGEEEEE